MLFYPINLPWPILLHAVGLTALGCSMLFREPTNEAPEDITTLEIATVGLGMSYLATSYMPLSDNQFLYASAPVRILLALLALAKYLLIQREPDARWMRYTRCGALVGILVYDGLGGLVLGWYLETLGGKVLAYTG